MDYTDIIAIIQQYVNMKAAVLAVVFTQVVKYFVKPLWTPETVPGKISTRLIPVLPLVVGGAFCALIEKDSHFVTEDIVRGAMSGTLAAWIYRTTKVSIFGE